MSKTIDLSKLFTGENDLTRKLEAVASTVQEASKQIQNLQNVSDKPVKVKVDTKELSEAQKIIQQYGKGGRSNYLVSEESALRNLTQAYEQYGKAISDAQKKQSKGDVIRWAGAYRGAGYDTSKVNKEVFDLADQLYESFTKTDSDSGKISNQMHYYSPESMKKLFDAMKSEAGGEYDFSKNELYWGKTRRDTGIGKQPKQVKEAIIGSVKQGVEDASKEKVEVPLEDILNVSIGNGKKDTIQKKVTALREELEKFYSKAYDKEGSYKQKADTTIDQYIRKYSEYAKYMELMKQNVEQRYTDIYDNIHKFSKTRTIVAPTKYKAGQDDFAQLKAQEMGSAKSIVDDIWAKAERKASAQLAVGIKPSAKAAESGEDVGEKIADGMKKATAAAQETKEKVEQVGEAGESAGEKAASGMKKAAESAKETRQEMEQAGEAARSAAEAEKPAASSSTEKSAKGHREAAAAAEEHAEKAKEAAQAEEQVGKKKGEVQAQSKPAEKEYTQLELLTEKLRQEEAELDRLQKKADETKAAFDRLADAQEQIHNLRDVQAIVHGGEKSDGTVIQKNEFGFEGNTTALSSLVRQKISEGKMSKAAAYYGEYVKAGGTGQFFDISGTKDITKELKDRYDAMVSAISQDSTALLEELKSATDAVREQRSKVDMVKEAVKAERAQVREQKKFEAEMAAESKAEWSQGLNENAIAGVEAYIKKAKALRKEAYNETEALAQAMDLVGKIEKRDIPGLMDQFTKDTHENNALLGKMTGMQVRSQKQRNEALRSLDQDQYDKLIKDRVRNVNTAAEEGAKEAEKKSSSSRTSQANQENESQIQLLGTLEQVEQAYKNMLAAKERYNQAKATKESFADITERSPLIYERRRRAYDAFDSSVTDYTDAYNQYLGYFNSKQDAEAWGKQYDVTHIKEAVKEEEDATVRSQSAIRAEIQETNEIIKEQEAYFERVAAANDSVQFKHNNKRKALRELKETSAEYSELRENPDKFDELETARRVFRYQNAGTHAEQLQLDPETISQYWTKIPIDEFKEQTKAFQEESGRRRAVLSEARDKLQELTIEYNKAEVSALQSELGTTIRKETNKINREIKAYQNGVLETQSHENQKLILEKYDNKQRESASEYLDFQSTDAYSQLDEKGKSYVDGLIQAYQKLEMIRNDGGLEYLQMLKEEKAITEEIAGVKEKIYNAQDAGRNGDTIDIENLKQQKEVIDSIIERVQKLDVEKSKTYGIFGLSKHEAGSGDIQKQIDSLLQIKNEIDSAIESVGHVSSQSNAQNFASDIRSLEGYSTANQEFVNQLIASVLTGQKEYDAAMEELKSHIAQRQEEIRAEQEKNLRVNTEIGKFASGSKPILDAMGIAENGPYPTEYSDYIAKIQSESIKGEEAVTQFADTFGFVYDQINDTWARPTSRKDDFLNSTIEGYKEYLDTVAGGAEIMSMQTAWDKMMDQKTFNGVLDAVNKINEAFRQGKLDSEGYVEGLGRLDGMDWAKYYARYLTKDDRFGHGARYLDEAPEGWKKLEGALTAPQGYEWYSNGASRFSNEYQAALVKVREETQTTKDTIVRSQEEIQAEIERTNDVIKIQEQWMKYLGDPNAPVTSTGKRDATDTLRNATKRLANYRMYPEEFIGQMDEEKITVHWWKAMQEAQRQGVADSVISRYRTDISESDYNEALAKLQESLALHKDILQKSKDELVQLQAELQQAASEGVARNPSLSSPAADQHREQQQSAEDAATSEEHLKEAEEAAAQAGASSGEATQQHREQADSAESAASAEEHLKDATQDSSSATTGSVVAADAHRQQEEAANAATDAEEKLKGATAESQQTGSQESGATHAHREQQKAAEDAADAEKNLLQLYNEAEAGLNGARLISEKDVNNSVRQNTYQISKGLTATGLYTRDEEGNWALQAVSSVANYNTLLQDTLKYTKALETAQASLQLAYEKQSGKEVIDSIQAQIRYYQDMIDKNNELADSYARISGVKNAETGGLPYTKEQYDSDVVQRTKEIQLQVAKQSAEQIERQQARNEAELKKNQAEIDKANNYVTQQIQRLRDVENKYDYSVNAQASRGIGKKDIDESGNIKAGSNLSQFQEKVRALESFLEGMRDTKLDPNAMNNVITMFGELKRFGDNSYLEETAKKGDLSRQSVDSMKKVLTENIGSFISTAKLSKGDTSGIQAVAEQVQQSISGMVSGDEVSAAFTKLKELRAELKRINDEARLDQQAQKETAAQYDEYINKIQALIDARSQLNQIQANQIKGEPGETSMEEGLENVKNKAIEAEQAFDALIEMWRNGLIKDSDFYKASDLFYSEDANQGSMKSRTEYAKAFAKAIEELGNSYIKLADAQEKANHSKTAAGREIGQQEVERIKTRQSELKSRLGNYDLDENEYIKQSKYIAGLKTAEYEEKRNATVDTRGLGFGTEDNIGKTWDVLIQKAQQYQQILYKSQSGATLTVNEEATLKRLAPLYEEAEKQALKMGDAFDKYKDKYTEMHDQMSLRSDAIAAQTIENLDKQIGGLEAPGRTMPDLYNEKVEELRANLEQLKQIDIENPEWFTTLDKINAGLQDLKTNRSAMAVDENRTATLDRQMSVWLSKNTNAGEYADQVRMLQQQLHEAASAGDQDRIAQGFEKIRAQAAEAGKTGLSFTDGLIRRFKSLGQYLLSFASFYRIIGILKQAVSIVKELDSGLMEVRKVAQESTSTLKEWQKTTFNQADIVGGNATQIEKSTAAWLRLGKSFEESQEAAQASVKLLNVSEFQNIDDATTSLVSMRQAFDDLTYEDFIDKLNGVGDNFSSSTDQLAQGMQNVSAVLKVQGNDIDQSLALLTAANDITQDMSKASMGVRTIALRIAGTKEAKEELEELGEDTSDFVVQTQSKVDAQVRNLTKTASNPNGISVLDENGRLRDTYDVLLDIAKVYDEIVAKDDQMGTNTSNALLELLAGKTRSNILASILQNPQLLEDAYEQSKNSKGIGQKELDVYLDSIEAKMAKMQNRIQELAYTAFDSDFIKTFIDGLTEALKIITKIVDTAGLLPTLLGAVGGFALQKSGLGLAKYDRIQGTWGAGGMPGAISGLFKKVTTKYTPNQEVAAYLAGFDPSRPLYGKGGALEGVNLGKAPQALREYTEEALRAGNATATVGDALRETGTSITGFSGLLSNAGSLLTSFLSTMGTMAIVMAASWAIGEIAKGIWNLIHAEENMIKKGKEATDSINDRYKAYEDLRDELEDLGKSASGKDDDLTTSESISEISKKYAELHDGVNALNNENRNLSTDKYQEYLDLCKQLAEQSPTLVKGYDSQGNAILNLGNTAAEAESALMRMYEAEKLAANVKIGEEAQTSYDGIIAQIKQQTEKNNSLQNNLLQLQEKQKQNQTDQENGKNNNYLSIDGTAIHVSNYSYELETNLRKILDGYNVSLNSLMAGSPSVGEPFTFAATGLQNLSDEQISSIQEQIYNAVQSSVEVSGKTIAADIEQVQSQMSANDLFIEDQKKSITGIISNYLTTSDIFGDQDKAIQDTILSNLDSLDLSVIGNKYEGQIIPYIYGELIQPLKDELTPEVQNVLTGIFDIETSEMPAGKYVESIWNSLGEAFGHDANKMQKWKDLLGFGEIFNEVADANSIIKAEFTDSGNELTEEQLGELYGLSLDDLRIYADLVKENVYTTWDELQAAFEKRKQERKANPTDTLSDVLNDETYKESADTFASNLSTLTGALETLRTEGHLTAEEMRDLQEAFPDLTEFTTEAIQAKAFEELDKQIDLIRDKMADMSPEGVEQARMYIRNMIDSYGDLGLSVNDIADEYYESLGIDKSQIGTTGIGTQFYSRVEDLRSKLAENGEELDTHVLYTLVASDQFSGTADEIYKKYQDTKVNWEITVDEKKAARDIQIAESKIQAEQAKRSAKEASGEMLGPEDYQGELNILNGKVKTASEQTERARKKWKEAIQTKTDQGTVDTLFTQYQDYLVKQQETESEQAQVLKEQAESNANKELHNLNDSNNAISAAQNKIAEAEKDGGKASQELYDQVATEQENQATINRRLGDIFQNLANNTDNEQWKTEWQEQANNYYAAAIQSESDAMEQRRIPLQNELNELQNESNEIQRDITKAEQKNQKVTKQTYRDLLANGQKQIRNLRQQQEKVVEFGDSWWDLQNSIESMQDSMFEWGQSLDRIVYDQAAQLAEAINTAISESASETGLTTETINALITGFSDLSGKQFDLSDMFYNTADGVKVNTEALRELTQAEFDMISVNLADEIQTIQDKMDNTTDQTVWNSYNEQLQTLMQTQAQYFAQYEEMQKALSYNNAIDIAEGTTDKGANYDSNYERLKTYKEDYENGKVGTDQFKAFTAYGDVFGRNTYEAFEAVLPKFERYFTEDATVGIENFLKDLQAKGLAEYSDAEGWNVLFENEEDAARAMGMGPEFFNDMFGKIQDLGGYYAKVGSLTEYELNKQDLNAQLEAALQTYIKMQQSGKATTDELKAQEDVIAEIRSQLEDNETNKDNYLKDEAEKRKEDFVGLQDNLKMYQDLYDKATSDEERNAIRKMAEQEIAKYGYDLKEGEIALSEKAQQDYESRFTTTSGSLTNPLSAEEMGIANEEDAKKYNDAVSALEEMFSAEKELQQLQQEREALSPNMVGNVDLNHRPVVLDGEDYHTLLSSTYFMSDFGLPDGENGEVAFNVTPILPDGTMLDSDGLEQYISEQLASGKKLEDLDIFMGSFGSIEEAENSAIAAHEANADMYGREAELLRQIQEDSNLSQLTDSLSGMTAEQLKGIDYNDHQYTEGFEAAEDAIDQLRESLELSVEDTDLLIDALAAVGLIEGSTVADIPDELADGKEQLEEFISARSQMGQDLRLDLEPDLSSMTQEEIQNHIDEIGEVRAAISPDDTEMNAYLDELKENATVQFKIQAKLESGDFTLPEIKRLIDTGDDEGLAAKLGIDMTQEGATDQLERYKKMLQNMPQSYDMVVHIDDSQFQQLVATVTGEPINAEITADTDEAEGIWGKFKKTIESNPIVQTITQFFTGSKETPKPQQTQTTTTTTNTTVGVNTSGGNKDLNKFEKNVENVNKTTGTATVQVNTDQANAKINALRNNLLLLNQLVVTPQFNESAIVRAITRTDQLIQKLQRAQQLKQGSAVGTAHARGTTTLSHSYASGTQDWTVGQDESALVNEIGQESIVRDGVWSLIPGGPHVEDLKRDDIIFNAEQTDDLIRTGRTARSGKLVAHANGTVDNMSAFASLGRWKNRKKNSTNNNSGGGGGGGNNKSNGGKGKRTSNLDRFNKWLGKLFDWIEVRLDRIQRQIDLSTAKAENAIGNIADGVEKIGTISSNKNKNINNAMRNISTVNGNEQYELVKSSAGTTDGVQRVTGVKYSNIGSADTLINNNLRGANRYFAEAEKVAKKATSGKTKIIDAKKADAIIAKIQSGQINIAEYSEKERAFIDAYKQWYDKAMDCVQAVEDLKQQLKELQQTKLDNITDEFEAIVGYQEAITDSSKAMVEYYKSFGQNVNTGDRKELLGQRDRQQKITNDLALEFDKYTEELKNAKEVFGENSNEYHEALTTWEGIRKEWIESRKATVELTHEIDELAFTVRGYAIDRLKTLGDKLASIASLAEKRGTDTRGHRVVENYYSNQLGANYQMILKYQEEINERKAQMEKYIKDEQEGLRVDSALYQELSGKINDAETQILSLLSANEDLVKSMRGLRWKGYEDLQRQLNNAREDFQHIRDLIRDGEILDDDGQLTERGFASIALIGEDMLIAEKNISNAKAALQKLDEEYKNGVINLETYNSEVDEQIGLIQDNAKAIQDDQQALADIKIDQITAQNDALQDLIKARQDALSAKKEYYDWDKTLKNKNKDIAQLQAQINALNGVTNDAAKARRAQLEAELSEKQEDLNDTLYEHSIELQQEGYDQLSEDMQEALDNAIKLINGDQKELLKTANAMLAQLKTNNINEKEVIEGIIEDRGTAIHDRQYPDDSIQYSNETQKFLEDTLGNGSLQDQLGVNTSNPYGDDGKTVGQNISDITPADAITSIKTDLQSYLTNVDGEFVGIGGKLDDIEEDINKYYDKDKRNAVLEELEQLAKDYDDADKVKAKEVSDAISALTDKDSATLADKDAIAEALAKYNSLTENQKGYVGKEDTDKLTGLSDKMTQLEEEAAKANSVPESQPEEESTLEDLAKQNDINTLAKDPVMAAIQTGVQRSTTVTSAEKKNHVPLWTYLVQKTGYAPTAATYKALAKALNVSVKNANKITKAEKDKILKKLKKHVFPAVQQISAASSFAELKSGAKKIDEDMLAWTNEEWDKNGSEMIVRAKDNAILTPLKANDTVIPADLAKNLFKWGAISPDKFIINPFVGKWSADGGSTTNTDADYSSAAQTIEMHFDSLFHIDGNVDESVMPRLENLGKSLVNDRDFQKNVIKFVTKDFVRESKKQGIR